MPSTPNDDPLHLGPLVSSCWIPAGGGGGYIQFNQALDPNADLSDLQFTARTLLQEPDQYGTFQTALSTCAVDAVYPNQINCDWGTASDVGTDPSSPLSYTEGSTAVLMANGTEVPDSGVQAGGVATGVVPE